MAKHTPGPWSYGRLDHKVILVEDDFAINAFNGSAHGTVAYLYDQNWSGAGGQIDISNACLISAAPDLLEACKIVLEGYDDSESDDYFDWPEAVKKIRAAIAKAEGRDNG